VRRASCICLTVFSLLLQGCQTATLIIRDPQAEEGDLGDLRRGVLGADLAQLSAYALLAEAGYHDGPADGAACPTPPKWRSRWTRVEGFLERGHFPSVRPGRMKVPGIGYQLWRDSEQGRLALVFRGTDFNQFGDWYSNFRWITRFNPLTWDQYAQTRDLVRKIVPLIDRKFGPDSEIIAIGHSLGGGLAQQAAYTTTRINKVYAFATSPVTGASSIDPAVSSETKRGVEIFRIYEAGEILASVRWIGRRLLPLSRKDPKITELRFNFRSTFKKGNVGGGPVGQHSMLQLACDIICRVDHELGEAECRKPVEKRRKR
jgi:hypothetical protein